MKALGQLLPVSWTERKSNHCVLEKAGVELEEIKKRKLFYFGHMLWKEGSCLEKEIKYKTHLQVSEVK